MPEANNEAKTKTAADRSAQVAAKDIKWPSCPTLVATWKQHKCGAAEDKVLNITKIE